MCVMGCLSLRAANPWPSTDVGSVPGPGMAHLILRLEGLGRQSPFETSTINNKHKKGNNINNFKNSLFIIKE